MTIQIESSRTSCLRLCGDQMQMFCSLIAILGGSVFVFQTSKTPTVYLYTNLHTFTTPAVLSWLPCVSKPNYEFAFDLFIYFF